MNEDETDGALRCFKTVFAWLVDAEPTESETARPMSHYVEVDGVCWGVPKGDGSNAGTPAVLERVSERPIVIGDCRFSEVVDGTLNPLQASLRRLGTTGVVRMIRAAVARGDTTADLAAETPSVCPSCGMSAAALTAAASGA